MFDDIALKTSTYYSYLGIIFSNRLSWSESVQTPIHKASKTVFPTEQLQLKLINLAPSILLECLIQIKPILLFLSEVWHWGLDKYGRITWASNVNKLLYSYGFNYV